MSDSPRPGGSTVRASTAPLPADIRSSVRYAPTHTDPAGPSATPESHDTLDGDTERTVCSVSGSTCPSTGGIPALGHPDTHR
jgi:hypothetical protein